MGINVRHTLITLIIMTGLMSSANSIFAAEDNGLNNLYKSAQRQPNRENYRKVCDYIYTNDAPSPSIYDNCLKYFKRQADTHKSDYILQGDYMQYTGMHHLMNGDEQSFSNKMKGAVRAYAKACDKESEASACCILGEYLNNIDPDMGHKYIMRGLKLLKGKMTIVHFELLCNEAANLFFHGDIDGAIGYYNKAAAMGWKLKQYQTLSTVYSSLGVMHRRKLQPDKAMKCYKTALKLTQKEKMPAEESNVLTNIAVLYSNQNRQNEALTYAYKAVGAAARCNDEEQKMQAGHTLGSIMMKRKNYRKAIPTLRGTLKMAERLNSPMIQLGDISFLITSYDAIGRKDSADYFLTMGNKIERQQPQESIYSLTFTETKALYNMKYGRYKDALNGFLTLKTIQNKQSQVTRDELYRHISKCYAGTGDYLNAYIYSEESHAMRDSVQKMELDKQLSDFSIKYKVQEKELANARLSQHLQEQKAYNRGLLLVLLISLFVVSALTALLLYRRKMQRIKETNMRHDAETTANRKYINGLEDERLRLAREMHDGVCNDLMGVEMTLKMQDGIPEDVISMVKSSRNNVRDISHRLMPPQFSFNTLPLLLSDWAVQTNNRVPYNVTFTVSDNLQNNEFDDTVSFSLYRIVQEVFNNIATHAHPTYVEVTLSATSDSNYSLTIKNDGAGKDASKTEGIGAQSIKSRARGIEAILQYDTVNDVYTLNVSGQTHIKNANGIM